MNEFDEVMRNLGTKAAISKVQEQMERLRNIDTKNFEERIIWELIQNACDCATDEGIDIKIETRDNLFVFIHDGKSFNAESLVELVTQLSGKKLGKLNKECKPIGYFGTGFVTTHLLSEQVKIQGSYEVESDYLIPFELLLDRSGKDEDELLDNINNNLQDISKIASKNRELKYIKKRETKFIYEISQEKFKYIDLIKEQIEKYYIYLLVTNKCIKNLYYNEFCYKRKSEEKIAEINGITVIKIEILAVDKENETSLVNEVLLIKRNDIELLVAIKNNKILPIDGDIYKLFLALPIVGKQFKSFPMVINTKQFKVDETRTNVVDSEKNREIFLEVSKIYIEILKYFCKEKYRDIFNVCIKKTFKETLFKDDERIRDTLKTLSMIECENDIYKNYNEVFVARFKNNKIIDFNNSLFNCQTPKKVEINSWYEIFGEKQSFKERLLKNLFDEKIIENYGLDHTLTKLIEFYNIEFEFEEMRMYTNEDSIMLNQNLKFIELKNICIDDKIDKELKDIAEKFGINLKSKLMNEKIYKSVFKDKNVDFLKFERWNNQFVAQKIINKITAILNKNEKEKQKFKKEFRLLVEWFNKNIDNAKELFGNIYIEQYKLWSNEDVKTSIELAEETKKILNINTLEELKIKAEILRESDTSVEILKYKEGDNGEWFEKILSRAKEKIFEQLEKDSYDISHKRKITETIYDGIKNKNKEDKIIVIRPSDNGKIILFEENNIGVLKEENYELWIASENERARKINLGDILAVTGITQIPLKNIFKED